MASEPVVAWLSSLRYRGERRRSSSPSCFAPCRESECFVTSCPESSLSLPCAAAYAMVRHRQVSTYQRVFISCDPPLEPHPASKTSQLCAKWSDGSAGACRLRAEATTYVRRSVFRQA